MLVSVIIPTYNSALTLQSCIQSVKKQTYKNIEIIIVDNLSKDETQIIAANNNAMFFAFRSNLPEARNYGLEKANGKYVCHLDSDMFLTPKIIEQCVKKCELQKYDAISIPEVSFGNDFLGKCIALEKIMNSGDEAIITPRFFKRQVLNALGGSDETLAAGEDWDLWIRLRGHGCTVSFITDHLIHREEYSLKTYFRKKYRWSKTLHKYLSKHPSNAAQQWAPLKPHQIWLYRKKIASMPQYFIGLLSLKILKLFIGVMGLLAREN